MMEKMNAAKKSLDEAVKEVIILSEKYKTSINIPEVCLFYKELKEGLQSLNSLIDVLSGIETIFGEGCLPKLMSANKVDSIRTGNRLFTNSARLFASMPKDKEARGITWLREAGHGDIIKEGVNAQTLSAVVNEYIEEHGKLPPEDAVTVYIQNKISMRKAK